MSIRVVTESHMTGDDYGYAASPEDIVVLQAQINVMKQKIADRITEDTLNNKVSIVDDKITNLRESLKTLKNDIISILEKGMWKQTFSGEIEKALTNLESRFSEMNSLLDEKMMELPRLDAIESNINAVFLAQGDKIKSIIINEGKSVCEQIHQQARQSDLLSALNKEAQSITWENKP